MNMGAMGAVGGGGSGGGGAAVLPDWDMDFARDIYYRLNMSGLTFTRGSAALAEDTALLWTSFSSNVPRRNNRGFRSETQAAYGVRRNDMNAATVGVIGAGGAFPDNMTRQDSITGLTFEIMGKGTEFGLPYVDIKITGTPGSTGDIRLALEALTQIAALNGQTWIAGAYITITAGALTNVGNFRFSQQFRDAGGSSLTTAPGANFTPSGSRARYSGFGTAVNASTAFNEPELMIAVTSGQQIGGGANGFTMRLASHNACQGNYLTSPVTATGSPFTRANDAALLTDTSLVDPSVGSLLIEWEELVGINVGPARTLACIRVDGSNQLRLIANGGASGDKLRFQYTAAGATSCLLDATNSPAAGNIYKSAVRWAANNFALAASPSLQAGLVTDVSGAVFTGAHGMGFGCNNGGGEQCEDNIKRLIYYRRALTDTEMLTWVTS